MNCKSVCIGIVSVLAPVLALDLGLAGPAHAQRLAFGAGLEQQGALAAMPLPPYGAGLRDVVDVPAPIPVPAPMPVPEGFTYYLRGDLGWAWTARNPSFSESGLLYGQDAPPPSTSAGAQYSASSDGSFGGTFGFGAYLTPRLRGDITLDFRAPQKDQFNAAYAYLLGPTTVNGTVSESLKVSRFVGLANLYLDILPRGIFSPYVGAGVGFVYNQIDRTYLNTEDVLVLGVPRSRTGSGGDNNMGLAAALMGGVTIAFDHRWALDIGYRAMYLQGGEASVTVPSMTGIVPTPQTSVARLGDAWEHQVRVGLRFNIW